MSKSLILVGMGRGNGLAIAKRFGKEGFKIYMVARSEAKLAEFKSELESQKIKTDYKVANAGDEAELRMAIKDILREDPSPDVLVYNASILKPASPSRLIPEQLVADFRVNVVGALVCAQEILPEMKKRKKGTILFTGGGLSLEPYVDFASLAIGKAGIRNLTYSLAQECEPLGVHVATVTICGMVEKGTKFDPDKIAEKFLELHLQKPGKFETEFMFQ